MKHVTYLALFLSTGAVAVYSAASTPPAPAEHVRQGIMGDIPPLAPFVLPVNAAAAGALPPGWDDRGGSLVNYRLRAPVPEDRVPVVIAGKTYWQPKDFPVLELSGGIGLATWTDNLPYVVAYAKNGYHAAWYLNPSGFYAVQFAP